MVLYFLATGNTQYAARRIAEATKDTLVSIRDCMSKERRRILRKSVPALQEKRKASICRMALTINRRKNWPPLMRKAERRSFSR